MQFSINEDFLEWKKLNHETFVTHFTSNFNIGSSYTSSSNQQIYLKKIKASKKSKSPLTIFLFHDLASYHGRFFSLINWFKSNHPDVNFVMMDFLGHGLSSGTRGHVEEFGHIVNDVAFVFRTMKKEPEERWIALGQGLGALSLLELVNRFDETIKSKIDKFVLSNFILDFNHPAINIQNKLMSKIKSFEEMIKTMRPLEIYLPKLVLTDPKRQRIYIEDPLILRRPSYQTFKCINLKIKTVFQDSYFLDRPTLILQSESPYLLPRGMDSFSKGLKKDLLSEKKYSNLKHDLYNEKDNIIVYNDIADWIQL